MHDLSTQGPLPISLREQIRKEQAVMFKRFNSGAALDWIPHITLAYRFLVDESEFENLCKKMESICEGSSPLTLSLHEREFITLSQSPFEHPHVIWYRVEATPALHSLHHQINAVLNEYDHPGFFAKDYRPHVTLAYRDLTTENFEKAKQYWETQPIQKNTPFQINEIVFAEKQSSGKWEHVRKFPLGK